VVSSSFWIPPVTGLLKSIHISIIRAGNGATRSLGRRARPIRNLVFLDEHLHLS
jgi:hypothetical protein